MRHRLPPRRKPVPQSFALPFQRASAIETQRQAAWSAVSGKRSFSLRPWLHVAASEKGGNQTSIFRPKADAECGVPIGQAMRSGTAGTEPYRSGNSAFRKRALRVGAGTVSDRYRCKTRLQHFKRRNFLIHKGLSDVARLNTSTLFKDTGEYKLKAH